MCIFLSKIKKLGMGSKYGCQVEVEVCGQGRRGWGGERLFTLNLMTKIPFFTEHPGLRIPVNTHRKYIIT